LFVGEEPSNTVENMAEPNTSTNMFINISSGVPSLLQEGYTILLLGLDEEASAEQKLNFDELANDSRSEQ
jgi:hypothetical protein